MIAIIDYDAGNIKSVEKALKRLGQAVKVTRDREEILHADKVILPGVGSFGDAMEKLVNYGLKNVIYEVVDKKIPFLGICLGMQLLFTESEESPGVLGLDIFKGRIVRIPDRGLKIPHIGWNDIKLKKDSKILGDLGDEPFVYFVHSYYLQADDEAVVSAYTEYGEKLDVAVEQDNIFATQFHPEKSGKTGLKILKNFIEVK